MAKKEMSTPQFNEADFLVKVKECGNSMARGDFFKKNQNTTTDISNEIEEENIPRRQRIKSKIDYKAIFLAPKVSKEKSARVTINVEYHIVMLRLMGAMGNKKISITNYLNNIIESHLNEYKNEINELYQKTQSDNIL